MTNAYSAVEQIGEGFRILTREPVTNRSAQAAPAPIRIRTAVYESDDLISPLLGLVHTVFFSDVGPQSRVLAFCGVEGECQAWEICRRVARLLADQSLQSVCLVDARHCAVEALRTPRLYNTKRGAEASARCRFAGNHLWTANESTLHAADGVLLPLAQIKERLAALKEEFQFVILCTGGLLVNPEACILGQMAGSAVLVVDGHTTGRRQALEAARKAKEAGIDLIGSVLNNTEPYRVTKK